MDNMLSASDVALLQDGRGKDNWGDNSFMWIFALLLLFGGGFGGIGGRGQQVTEADLCSANSFQELKNMTSRMNDNLGKGICDLGYETARQFGDVEKQLAQCCCEQLRAVDSVKFDMANYNAQTNAHTTEIGQKILDAISTDKFERMQARINDLERDKALCGVVRYPLQMTYSSNCNPFCPQPNYGCGNGCY